MSRGTLLKKTRIFGQDDLRTIHTASGLAAILKDIGAASQSMGDNILAVEMWQECE